MYSFPIKCGGLNQFQSVLTIYFFSRSILHENSTDNRRRRHYLILHIIIYYYLPTANGFSTGIIIYTIGRAVFFLVQTTYFSRVDQAAVIPKVYRRNHFSSRRKSRNIPISGRETFFVRCKILRKHVI